MSDCTWSTTAPKVSRSCSVASGPILKSDFEEEIKKVEDGVDLVIDFIGPSYFNQNLGSLRRDGTLVWLAMMSGAKLPEGTSIIPILFKRLNLKGSTLRSRTVEYQSDLLQQFKEKGLGLLVDGKMKVEVHEVYPWDKIADAHKLMEANKNSGKVSPVALLEGRRSREDCAGDQVGGFMHVPDRRYDTNSHKSTDLIFLIFHFTLIFRGCLL